MPVRKLAPAENPDGWASVVSTWQTAFAHVLPQLPVPPGSRLRPDAPDGRRAVLGAFESADDAVAAGLAVINESTARATAFWVAPALRRQGIGSALLAESRRLAKTLGHTKLVVRMPGAADAEGFAQARGGRLIERQSMSGLDLSTVDRHAFEEWAAPRAANRGYALVRWSDRRPDELAASFCAARTALADAPDTADTTPLTIEALREREQGLLRLGIHRHVHAVVAQDGEIAGFTNVVTVEDEPEVADVWNTAVVRAHRGRGLGLRVKAAATLWLLGEHPKTRWIRTFNHEANAPMLRVNRALGYQPLLDWLNFAFETD